ncbi:MAG TPA: hypothetical protein VFU43_25275 [Streptosporangiaceae bacterium]|nr:hypothetical protein [Streptosporangiaceae bacterium]
MPNQLHGFVTSNAFEVLPPVARTVAPDTHEYQTSGHRFLTLVVDVTAITATPGITVSVLGVDRASGKTWTVLTGAQLVAVTGATPQTLRVGPGLVASANAVANEVLPSTFRISVAHADADSITYSVGALVV